MQTKIIERYFFFSLLFVSTVFVLFIFLPFLFSLVVGASLAVVLYPVYVWFKNRKFPSWLASLSVVFLFIVVLCGPLLGIGAIVFNQSQDAYHSIVVEGNVGPFIDSINRSVNSILPQGFELDTNKRVSEFVSFLSNNIANVFNSTLSALFSFILTLVALFYFLKDGARWRRAIVVLSPLSDVDDEKIIKRLSSSVSGIIKGSLFIGIIQGLLVGIGFAIFGVPNPAFWGVVAAVASLAPNLGTALVSAPAIIYLFVSGDTANAIGLLVWSSLIVGMIDNLLSPFILGKEVSLPPFLVLFSVLGGISLLGPVGLLIGPLAVSLLYALVSIYRTDFKLKDIGINSK